MGWGSGPRVTPSSDSVNIKNLDTLLTNTYLGVNPEAPLDRLAVGSDNLWGGVVGPDDGVNGLYSEGPQPSCNPVGRYIVRSSVREEPLPPHLAQLVLTAESRVKRRLQRMLARARIQVTVAQMPVETYVKRRLQPIKVGR